MNRLKQRSCINCIKSNYISLIVSVCFSFVNTHSFSNFLSIIIFQTFVISFAFVNDGNRARLSFIPNRSLLDAAEAPKPRTKSSIQALLERSGLEEVGPAGWENPPWSRFHRCFRFSSRRVWCITARTPSPAASRTVPAGRWRSPATPGPATPSCASVRNPGLV